MKKLTIIATLLLSTQSFAASVLIQCWNNGAVLQEQNMILQNGGGNNYPNRINYNGEIIKIKASDSECLNPSKPSPCTDHLTISNGKRVKIDLERLYSMTRNTELLGGHLYGSRIKQVFCQRHSLN
jgi:hypothetical protein